MSFPTDFLAPGNKNRLGIYMCAEGVDAFLKTILRSHFTGSRSALCNRK